MSMYAPPHPGAFIKTEIIEPLALTVSAASKILGVSRPALSTLLNGRSDLSGDMALRIEKARGDARQTSDVDLLVDFDCPATFAGFMDLKALLEDALAVRVDLVTRKALRPHLRPRIRAEARRVA